MPPASELLAKVDHFRKNIYINGSLALIGCGWLRGLQLRMLNYTNLQVPSNVQTYPSNYSSACLSTNNTLHTQTHTQALTCTRQQATYKQNKTNKQHTHSHTQKHTVTRQNAHQLITQTRIYKQTTAQHTQPHKTVTIVSSRVVRVLPSSRNLENGWFTSAKCDERPPYLNLSTNHNLVAASFCNQ